MPMFTPDPSPKGLSARGRRARKACAAAVWASLAVAVALGAGSPGASPRADESQVSATLRALGPEFRRTETDHFVILSDSSRQWTRTRADILEQTADRFDDVMATMGLTPSAPRAKLLCVLFDDHDRFEAFAAAQDGVMARWVGGYYATGSNRVVFFNPRTGPGFDKADERVDEARRSAREAERGADEARRKGDDATAEVLQIIARRVTEDTKVAEDELAAHAARAAAGKTTHEALHLLAFNRGLQSRSRTYPFWMSEGFAASFEASSEEDAREGRFGPGHPVEVRERELDDAVRSGQLLPLRRLLVMEAAPVRDSAAAGVMYAQSYGFFRYLFERNPKALGALFSDLNALPEGQVPPDRYLALFEARFGPLGQVERTWRAYLNSRAQPLAGADEASGAADAAR